MPLAGKTDNETFIAAAALVHDQVAIKQETKTA